MNLKNCLRRAANTYPGVCAVAKKIIGAGGILESDRCGRVSGRVHKKSTGRAHIGPDRTGRVCAKSKDKSKRKDHKYCSHRNNRPQETFRFIHITFYFSSIPTIFNKGRNPECQQLLIIIVKWKKQHNSKNVDNFEMVSK